MRSGVSVEAEHETVVMTPLTKENRMTSHEESLYRQLKEAKKEIEQQAGVIDMLKEAQINYQLGGKVLNTSDRPIERIVSANYKDHMQQALHEAGSLYASTKEGSPLYHGLQSIAQSSIAITMLLDELASLLIDKEN